MCSSNWCQIPALGQLVLARGRAPVRSTDIVGAQMELEADTPPEGRGRQHEEIFMQWGRGRGVVYGCKMYCAQHRNEGAQLSYVRCLHFVAVKWSTDHSDAAHLFYQT